MMISSKHKFPAAVHYLIPHGGFVFLGFRLSRMIREKADQLGILLFFFFFVYMALHFLF